MKLNRLSQLKVRELKVPGQYLDGGGLYLRITESKTKNWIFRYVIDGKERRQGLGSYPDVSLEDARAKAQANRLLRSEGEDPIEYRRVQLRERKLALHSQPCFSACALDYINTHKSGWKNSKHEDQWRNTLRTYAYPTIGDMPIHTIGTDAIKRVLDPIWLDKTETATRVRQRLEKIFDWAETLGYREGRNPARWTGHLENLLAKPSKIRKVSHHPALPYTDIPAFYRWLDAKQTLAARTLQFTILTAARNGESRGALYKEIDLDNGCWTIPEGRMKAGRGHRVPLSEEALRILAIAASYARGANVFPGQQSAACITETALRKTLKEYTDGLTIHGFRSSFRDWVGEKTNFQREVAEVALSHVLADKTEAAYQRGDYFEKRVQLMEAWAKYCTMDMGNLGG
jgi:integrase